MGGFGKRLSRRFTDGLLSLQWGGLARVMAMETGKRPKNPQMESLLRAGREAFDTGDAGRAHDLWREAAILDPYDERTWLQLLEVLQTPEDRIVCLQNILSINPLNTNARRQLRAYEDREKRIIERTRVEKVIKVQRRRTFRGALLAGIAIGLLALLLGIFASVMVYGVGLRLI